MNETTMVHCNTCSCLTIHILCAKEEEYGKDNEHPIDWYDSFEILKCMGCLTMCSKHTSWFSEDCKPDGSPNVYVEYYPTRTNKDLEPDIIDNLPSIVHMEYHEAIGAYNAKLNLSCASALRATIEAICSDKLIKGGEVIENGINKMKHNLEGKINGLHEAGHITAEQANFLHETRFLGNEALHKHEVPNVLQLLAAIDIVEHMLIAIYELKDKANLLSTTRKLKEQKR